MVVICECWGSMVYSYMREIVPSFRIMRSIGNSLQRPVLTVAVEVGIVLGSGCFLSITFRSIFQRCKLVPGHVVQWVLIHLAGTGSVWTRWGFTSARPCIFFGESLQKKFRWFVPPFREPRSNTPFHHRSCCAWPKIPAMRFICYTCYKPAWCESRAWPGNGSWHLRLSTSKFLQLCLGKVSCPDGTQTIIESHIKQGESMRLLLCPLQVIDHLTLGVPTLLTLDLKGLLLVHDGFHGSDEDVLVKWRFAKKVGLGGFVLDFSN